MLTFSLLIGCFKVGDPQNIQSINPQKAEKYINKLRNGCSKDREEACFDLGKIYETGIVNHSGVFEKQMRKARRAIFVSSVLWAHPDELFQWQIPQMHEFRKF